MNLENDSKWNRRGTQKQPFTDVFQNRCPLACNFIEKRLMWYTCVFPVNIAKYLRTAFLYRITPVAVFAYSGQSKISREITASKINGHYAV